jgi:threonine dehydrogenase-like Zn-dependent dehydrogenase
VFALTVAPGIGNSARLEDVAEPALSDGGLLVRTVALGVCGTDRDIIAGEYGTAPPGEKRLILGHESLGRVELAPPHSGLVAGDLVVGIVRRPDPMPCCACAAGQWDMCRNGLYTERGIKERHGYGAERFASSRSSSSSSTPPSAFSACCWSPPALSPKHGTMSTASATAARAGGRAHCW